MLLLTTLLIEVDARIKDEVTRFHLFEGQIDWKRVVLISLIPAIQFEPEVFSQIVDNLADERAAVQEERCVVERLSRLVVPPRIRHAKVLDAPIDKLLAELSFEFRVSSVNCSLCSHVVSILDFVLFGLAESIEVGLETAGCEATSEAYKLALRIL